MNPDLDRQQMLLLARAAPKEQMRVIRSMTAQDMLAMDAAFENWADKGQLPPEGEGWRVWLMMAGRGFGKTRAGAEWIHRLASGRQKFRIALVAATMAEARSIMVEGVSGILAVAGRNNKRVKWEPSLNRLTWHGGSQAQLYSGDSADGLRGPEHHFAWCLAGCRRACGWLRRRGSASSPSGCACGRTVLHRRQQPDRGLGILCRSCRRVHRGWLALHPARQRNVLLRAVGGHGRQLPQRPVGNRDRTGIKSRDRR